MSLTRIPACTTKGCPAPSDPDFHACWCGRKEIEHHHVESRGMGGTKLKRNVVALCHKHHEAVTLHEYYDIVTVLEGSVTYTYMDARGEVLHTRTLEAGSAAAEVSKRGAGRGLATSLQSTRAAGEPVVPAASSAAAPPASGESSAGEAVLAARPMPNATAHGGSSPTPFSLEDWCAEGMQLVYFGIALRDGQDEVRFRIGDWFNKGEQALSDEAYGFLRGFEDVTVRQYSWVAGRVIPDTRVSELPWTFHRAVAALPEPEQKEWLKRAQEENLSSKDLNQAIHGKKTTVKRYAVKELREVLEDWPFAHGEMKVSFRVAVLAFADWLELEAS